MVLAKNEETELDNILQQYFTNKFRKGYVSIKGVTMPKRFTEMEEEIYNLEINEEDVWVCSFPKTGTTWTCEMVWMIMNNLDFVKGQEHIEDRFPFLELSAIFDFREMIGTVKDFHVPECVQDSVKYLRSMKSPKCAKTHLPWTLLPKEIQEGVKKPKIIYVARNPKDTCLSYYNHCRVLEGYTGNFEDFCKLFLAGKVAYAPFWDHILPFWNHRNQPNFLFLKFEDMIKDLPSAIKKVAQFLDKDLTDEQMTLLTEHLSFQSMKNNASVNFSEKIEFLKKHKLTSAEGSFMRSGKIGEGGSQMSPELLQKFEDWTKENLKGSDLSF